MRSIPHDPDALEANVLYPSDLNGDGYALTMRLENPDGEWKPDAEDPRLLVRRQADDGVKTGFTVHCKSLDPLFRLSQRLFQRRGATCRNDEA